MTRSGLRIESNSWEGAMQPSWTSPIPQAMQQHRGSQVQRTALTTRAEAGAHADTAPPPANVRDEAKPSESEPKQP
jgi:hypothetical protein